MNDILLLFLAIATHELGHYIHYLLLGFKPKIKWIGVGPCVEPEVKDIAVKYVIANIFIAITIGMIVLKLFHSTDLVMFAYFVGCFMDINNAQMLLIYVYRKTLTLDTSIDCIKVTIKGKVIA
jgi:hypothetical protein